MSSDFSARLNNLSHIANPFFIGNELGSLGKTNLPENRQMANLIRTFANQPLGTRSAAVEALIAKFRRQPEGLKELKSVDAFFKPGQPQSLPVEEQKEEGKVKDEEEKRQDAQQQETDAHTGHESKQEPAQPQPIVQEEPARTTQKPELAIPPSPRQPTKPGKREPAPVQAPEEIEETQPEKVVLKKTRSLSTITKFAAAAIATVGASVGSYLIWSLNDAQDPTGIRKVQPIIPTPPGPDPAGLPDAFGQVVLTVFLFAVGVLAVVGGPPLISKFNRLVAAASASGPNPSPTSTSPTKLHIEEGLRKKNIEVYYQNKGFFEKGEYETQGKVVKLDIDRTKQHTTIEEDKNIPKLNPIPVEERHPTIFRVANIDTCSQVIELQSKVNNPKKIAAINMANEQKPGGGYKRGAGAQEEAACRRTTMFPALKGLTYPFGEFSIIHCPYVEIFRAKDHILLDKTVETNFVGLAAYDLTPGHPGRKQINVPEQGSLSNLEGNPNYMVGMERKIRNLLRVMGKHGYKHLVLGALGSGAFENPPEIVAKIFHKLLLQDEEFIGRFETVDFAILAKGKEGPNNLTTYKNIFEGAQTTPPPAPTVTTTAATSSAAITTTTTTTTTTITSATSSSTATSTTTTHPHSWTPDEIQEKYDQALDVARKLKAESVYEEERKKLLEKLFDLCDALPAEQFVDLMCTPVEDRIADEKKLPVFKYKFNLYPLVNKKHLTEDQILKLIISDEQTSTEPRVFEKEFEFYKQLEDPVKLMRALSRGEEKTICHDRDSLLKSVDLLIKLDIVQIGQLLSKQNKEGQTPLSSVKAFKILHHEKMAPLVQKLLNDRKLPPNKKFFVTDDKTREILFYPDPDGPGYPLPISPNQFVDQNVLDAQNSIEDLITYLRDKNPVALRDPAIIPKIARFQGGTWTAKERKIFEIDLNGNTLLHLQNSAASYALLDPLLGKDKIDILKQKNHVGLTALELATRDPNTPYPKIFELLIDIGSVEKKIFENKIFHSFESFLQFLGGASERYSHKEMEFVSKLNLGDVLDLENKLINETFTNRYKTNPYPMYSFHEPFLFAQIVPILLKEFKGVKAVIPFLATDPDCPLDNPLILALARPLLKKLRENPDGFTERARHISEHYTLDKKYFIPHPKQPNPKTYLVDGPEFSEILAKGSSSSSSDRAEGTVTDHTAIANAGQQPLPIQPHGQEQEIIMSAASSTMISSSTTSMPYSPPSSRKSSRVLTSKDLYPSEKNVDTVLHRKETFLSAIPLLLPLSISEIASLLDKTNQKDQTPLSIIHNYRILHCKGSVSLVKKLLDERTQPGNDIYFAEDPKTGEILFKPKLNDIGYPLPISRNQYVSLEDLSKQKNIQGLKEFLKGNPRALRDPAVVSKIEEFQKQERTPEELGLFSNELQEIFTIDLDGNTLLHLQNNQECYELLDILNNTQKNEILMQMNRYNLTPPEAAARDPNAPFKKIFEFLKGSMSILTYFESFESFFHFLGSAYGQGREATQKFISTLKRDEYEKAFNFLQKQPKPFYYFSEPSLFKQILRFLENNHQTVDTLIPFLAKGPNPPLDNSEILDLARPLLVKLFSEGDSHYKKEKNGCLYLIPDPDQAEKRYLIAGSETSSSSDPGSEKEKSGEEKLIEHPGRGDAPQIDQSENKYLIESPEANNSSDYDSEEGDSATGEDSDRGDASEIPLSPKGKLTKKSAPSKLVSTPGHQ